MKILREFSLPPCLQALRKVFVGILVGSTGLLVSHLVHAGFPSRAWAGPAPETASASGPGTSSQVARSQEMPNAAQPTRVAEVFGRLPLSFEPNQGQTDPAVRFLCRGRGYSVFITQDEAVLSLRSQPAVGSQPSAAELKAGKSKSDRPSSNVESRNPELLRMKLVGASPTARLSGVEELPGKSNYFIGKDLDRWHTNIPNYRKVSARNVYPGIDLVYYGNQRQLEYDFVVAPGADPSKIRFAVQAGNAELANPAAVRIDARGDLVAQLDGGEIRFHKPAVYQVQSAVGSRHSAAGSMENRQSPASDRQAIEGRFVLLASAENQHSQFTNHKFRVGFDVGPYDRSKPLIIDPVLSYSTYLGGTNADLGLGIAVDSGGNAYITGQTCSPDFPTTPGVVQTVYGGNCDAFVSKLNATGTALVYSTFLGGSGGDYGKGIAVDASGDVFVVGFTNSTDFPVTPGTAQTVYGGGNSDAFVAELNASGAALLYATYLGGTSGEIPGDIALDSVGNAYVAGDTTSDDFPITLGVFQTARAGNDDAFVTKLNATGTALVYSTYLGGTDIDSAHAIAVDSAGSAHVVGGTSSSDFPLANPLQNVNNGPPPPATCLADAFITKLNSTGTGLVYSTYLGGSECDVASGIALDTFGDAFVTGSTSSPNFPTTPAAFQTTFGGVSDAFVAELNDKGSALTYSTYLGGEGADFGNGIAVDINGIAYVTGETSSTGFPTANPTQSTNAGGPSDAFVTRLNAQGSGLIFSTFLGGGDKDAANGIAADSNFNTYATGVTASVNFPATPGAGQTTFGGVTDAFVVKFSNVAAPVVALSPLSLNFGDQSVETSSTAQTITLTNSGDATLTIIGIDVAGAAATSFAQTNTCGNSVAAGGNCTIDVTFTPTTTGILNASLRITDNASTSPQVVSLTGHGTAPAVALSPTGLTFPDTRVGVTSAPLTITLTNTGDGTLEISSIAVTGDFAKSDNCGASVAAGADCTITVTFTPTASGSRYGTLTITDNAANSPQVVQLAGNGLPAPLVTLAPSSLTFAEQPVNSTSTAQTAVLTNTGMAPLNITNIAPSGDFSQTNTCGVLPATVAAGASCAISVTFSPTAAGTRLGSVTITDDAGNSPQTIALSGTGVLAPWVTLTPTSLSYPDTKVGFTSAPLPVTITNAGSATLLISSIATTGDFSKSGQCGASIAAGANCVVSVTFTPTAIGNRYGTLTVADNASGSPQQVQLAGNGLPAPAVTLAPTSLTFAQQAVNTTSAAQSVVLTNSGTAPLNISGVAVTGTNSGDFAVASLSCGAALGANATCTVSVTFTPTASGTRVAALTFTDDAANSPQSVALTGSGILAPAVALNPLSLTFPDTSVGITSAPLTVTVTNSGSATLLISSVATTGDFAQNGCLDSSNNLVGTLTAGNQCKIYVTFTPTAASTRYGTLTITDNAANSPQTVPLAGNGLPAPIVTLSPLSVTFADQPLNTSSSSQSVELTNTGNAALTVTSVTVTGANAGDFALVGNTCGGTIQPISMGGQPCTISVTFTPTAAGARSAAITIVDNAPMSPQTVPLTGNGILQPAVSFNPTSLTFPSAPVGTPSSASPVTLTNSGAGPLTISRIEISGTNKDDFSQTNNCPVSPATLAPSLTCTIGVVFTPSAAGTRFAALLLTDNAPGSPQSVPLTGGGAVGAADYTLSASPTTNTIFAGDSISYTLTVTPINGSTAKVGLSCTGAPRAAVCTVTPSSVTLDGTNPSIASVNVSTTARTLTPPLPGPLIHLPGAGRRWFPWMLGMLLMTSLILCRRRVRLALGTMMLLVLLWSACGGGGQVGVPSGTPAGSYTLTVTGVSGTTSKTTTVTLRVN